MSGGQGADDGETGLFIEQGIAYHQSRTASLLLMTGLRVKGYSDEVSLFWNICLHLPDLSTDRLTPIRFFGFIAFRYLRYQLLQASFAPDASRRRYHNEAVTRGYVYVITDRNTGIFKYLLCEA